IRDFHVTGVQTCALPIYFGYYVEGAFTGLDDQVARLRPLARHRVVPRVGVRLLAGGLGNPLNLFEHRQERVSACFAVGDHTTDLNPFPLSRPHAATWAARFVAMPSCPRRSRLSRM